MRILSPAPKAFLDSSGEPAYGSYAGPLPAVVLGRSAVGAFARRKKWLFVALSTDDLWISLAVVRMGYASSFFAYAHAPGGSSLLADASVVGSPFAATVTDDVHAEGELVRFRSGGVDARAVRAGEAVELVVRMPGLDLEATLDATAAPPALSAIVPLGPGLVGATEKRALAALRGRAVVAGQRHAFDGPHALGMYDYSHGLMPRRTRWRWACALGRGRGGAPIALNLTQGFLGEAECVVFTPETIHPVAEPRIEYEDRAERWKVGPLGFAPGAVHEQQSNFGIVRSLFYQPVGRFRGQLGDFDFEGVPGVVEDQDVLW